MKAVKGIAVAFEPISKVIENGCIAHTFKDEDVKSIEYYLTPVTSSLPNTVKLGAKCTLKNGEQYGNIIKIPFQTLTDLVAQYDI